MSQETYLENQSANITTQTTTLVASGRTLLHSIIINKPLANGTITIYDGLTAGGVKLATITKPGTLLSDVTNAIMYDIVCSIGLCVVTGGANQDITVTFKKP